MMETEYREGNGGAENGVGGGSKEVGVANKRKMNCSDLVLRFLALVLTLAAAIVLGVDKQTTTVSFKVISSLPPVNMPVHARWYNMSAFVYFVVANAIACSYAAISLIVTIATRGGKKGLSLMVIIVDVLMVALVFSGIGATSAIGVIGYEGNSHVRWDRVCNIFDKFCHQVAAAVLLSLIGSIAYILLILLAALNLHKKFK